MFELSPALSGYDEPRAVQFSKQLLERLRSAPGVKSASMAAVAILAGDGPAAYGTPVILAIVDEQGERCLRELAEDLAESYALFSRVEVNLIRERDLGDDERLDVALAPLLPCCRRMLGQEISRGEVQRFWETLRKEIHETAMALGDMFASHREQAAREHRERQQRPDSFH